MSAKSTAKAAAELAEWEFWEAKEPTPEGKAFSDAIVALVIREKAAAIARIAAREAAA